MNASELKKTLKQALPSGLISYITYVRQRAMMRRGLRMSPDELRCAVESNYLKAMGEPCNLDVPLTYNDKAQWMKLHGPMREYGRLADKYLVRDFVAGRIGQGHLIPLLGVWDDVGKIDFDSLPDRFVLKASHGCGWNIIVKDKELLNVGQTRRMLKRWLKLDWTFLNGYEMHYRFCEPRIIAEAYLANEPLDAGTPEEPLDDYKLWCFDGKVAYIQFLEGRGTKLKTAFFDCDWNRMPFVCNYKVTPPTERDVPRPDKLEQLIELGEKLAAGLPHVRVDLYLTSDGSIYFGEMTLTPASGYCMWNPPEANSHVGTLFTLPEPDFEPDLTAGCTANRQEA